MQSCIASYDDGNEALYQYDFVLFGVYRHTGGI